ncbi:tetratricopeptide repeat protein [Thermococcus barophilus]|nr:hypothetical protein [Thermococcus barophilus]
MMGELVKKFVKPEGITVEEFFAEGFSEKSLEDLEKAYEEAWEREKLLYADGYIKLLVSIAEYYEKRSKKGSKNEVEAFLDEYFGTSSKSPTYKKLVTKYYIKASNIATSVSLIYLSQQNNPEKAEKYLKLAVELGEKVMKLGVIPKDYSIILNILGTYYYETNRPEKALMVLKKALRYAMTPRETALTLYNLALTYAELGMNRKAIDFMVNAICIHYSTQHDFGDASLYDDDINRIIEMTGDANTDIYALKVALDLISGNLTAEEAKKLLEQIDRDEWPLTDALLSILNGEECMLSIDLVECITLLQDIAKIVGNENALKLQSFYPREVEEDLKKLGEYIRGKCGNVQHLTWEISVTHNLESRIKVNYVSKECYYLVGSYEELTFSWFMKRRNWRWRIKGIVWINEKPHILLGKVKKQRLWYALYNIDMSEPKIFNLPIPANFTGDLWNAWSDNLEKVLTNHFITEKDKFRFVLF